MQFTSSLTQPANTYGTEPFIISPWLPGNSGSCALNSPLYLKYTELYDEVKCIGMKIKLAVVTPIGTSDVPSLQIMNTFDRRFGIAYDAVNHQFIYDDMPNAAQLISSSNYNCVTAVNNSIAKIERSIYASDLLEKAQWHDCSCTTVTIDSNQVLADKAVLAAGMNPNFFHPLFLVTFAVPNAGAVSKSITLTCDVTFYFAFRNPKYGSAPTSAKIKSEPKTVDDDEDFDMDDLTDALDYEGLPECAKFVLADRKKNAKSKTTARDTVSCPKSPKW